MTPTIDQTVQYRVEGAIATLTLNRPERMNTMSRELLEAVTSALESAAGDTGVRVLVMTGAGRAFCAGGDLTSFAAGGNKAQVDEMGVQARGDQLRQALRTSQLFHKMAKVTIAAINGACAGAGLAWACAADIRLASESAMFNTAFMTAGLSGDFGGTWTLSRILGSGKARELYFLAEKFTAREAERIGLVSRCLPDAELMTEVSRIADRIAGFAPLTVRAMKANLNDAGRLSFSELLDIEAARQIQTGLTDDAREAASAFLEKRPPVFSGR